MFVARGTKDILVPKRYWRICMEKLEDIDVEDAVIEGHEYEGLGHSGSGQELRHLRTWLERVIRSVD